MEETTILGFDLGASNGRAFVGKLNLKDKRIKIEEVHKFPNISISVNNHVYWDILKLWNEIKTAIIKTYKKYNGKVESIGLDMWGVDYVLLGENEELLGLPRSYRDPSNINAMKELLSIIPKKEIYLKTGIQFTPINTLYQLFSRVIESPSIFKIAKKFLMLPDLFNCWLSDSCMSEYTEASTTQFLNPLSKKWVSDLLERINVPTHIFPEIIEPGTLLGKISKSVAEELEISTDINIIAPATHDTASAIAATPLDKESAYISSGTWSLVGIEINNPIINERAMKYNFTNEGGAFNTITFLRNIQGMWFIQEIRRILELRGYSYTYDHLTQLAADAKTKMVYIDPDDPRFLKPKDIIKEINNYLEETGQEKPGSLGELVRMILESLALKYRLVIEQASKLAGKKIENIVIIGGGSKNWLLNQLVADFTELPVVVGPAEATSIGNILLQAVGLNYIKTLDEVREYVKNSFTLKTYTPRHRTIHEDAYNKYLELLEKHSN